jgi:transposase
MKRGLGHCCHRQRLSQNLLSVMSCWLVWSRFCRGRSLYLFSGRRQWRDRKVLAGILFVLKTGIPWEDLPRR